MTAENRSGELGSALVGAQIGSRPCGANPEAGRHTSLLSLSFSLSSSASALLLHVQLHPAISSTRILHRPHSPRLIKSFLHPSTERLAATADLKSPTSQPFSPPSTHSSTSTTMLSVLISTYTPFPSTLSLTLPESTTISSLQTLLTPYCPLRQQSLSSHSVLVLKPTTTLSSLTSISNTNNDTSPLFLRLSVRLPGGKGGFASQLRAQGGRMSSNKATNNDSCRDLNGRRLSTIKEATKLAEYIQAAPDRLAQQKKEAQAKLDALNAEIERLDKGIHSKPSTSASSSASASGSGSGSGSNGGGMTAGQKRKLEESKFVKESKELNEGVRDAVKLAMMKKRKKNKTVETTEAVPATTSGSSEEEDPGKGKQKEETTVETK
ncbi:BQ5605_C009g05733 [Microbotryum silenes-dioicae]|uniref:BQ5605_C009g05733 protein n=1 Tax=Microbotryum silenes-dioicae TaxID=796604 RepID=A0A2X0MHF0_9BASI|nr:BQ5605_C009g05733 [Microbotryum silenes-dioicae]